MILNRRLFFTGALAAGLSARDAMGFTPHHFESYREVYATDDDAFEHMIQAAKDGVNGRRCTFDGQIDLYRKPPSIYRVAIEGATILGSTIVKHYPNGVLFELLGPPGWGGVHLHRFSVVNAPGVSGGYFFFSDNNQGFEPDESTFGDLYVGAGGVDNRPHRNFHIVGRRTLPIGNRVGKCDNVVCFGTIMAGSSYFAGIEGFYFSAFRQYPAPVEHGDMYVVGTDVTPAWDCVGTAMQVSGPLNLARTRNCEFNGDIRVLNGGNNLNARVNGAWL